MAGARVSRVFLLLLPVFLCVSCGKMVRTFSVNAINTDEKEVPAVILLDDEVYLDRANDPVLTPAEVVVEFEPGAGGDPYRKMKLGVKPVDLGSNGEIVRGLREGDSAPYLEPLPRFVQPTDARVQLFILRRNKEYVE